MTHSQPTGFQHAILSIAVSALLTGAGGLFSFNAWAQAGAAGKPGEPVTLNFQAAEIEAVARTFASITGRNVVVDPRVKGVITLVTEKPVSPAVAMNQFVAALRLQGFTLVESAGPITQPHELPAVPRPAGFGLAPGDDAYRATRHAVYRDEYGRERDVEDHSVAADVLEIHGFVARYLQAIAAGTLGRADAMRSMRESFFAVQPLIPRVLRALDELASW